MGGANNSDPHLQVQEKIIPKYRHPEYALPISNYSKANYVKYLYVWHHGNAVANDFVSMYDNVHTEVP